MPVKKETNTNTADNDERYDDGLVEPNIPSPSGHGPTGVTKQTVSGTASTKKSTQHLDSKGVQEIDYFGDTYTSTDRAEIVSDLLDVASNVFDRLKQKQLCQLRPKSDLLEQLKNIFEDMKLDDLQSTDQKEIKTMLLGMNMVGTVEDGGEDLSENHDDIYK